LKDSGWKPPSIPTARAIEEIPLGRFAILAPRALLVAAHLDNSATALARERLLKAGFANVSVLVDARYRRNPPVRKLK
jgi:hypothetical protein